MFPTKPRKLFLFFRPLFEEKVLRPVVNFQMIFAFLPLLQSQVQRTIIEVLTTGNQTHIERAPM